jgi:hypothetical protein
LEFFVNRGTKEGGINSPSIFNTVYAFLLRKVGVQEYPSNHTEFDPDKVYYLVFADDLVILGSNMTNLEETMKNLDRVLEEVGMKVNAGKTKWLAYLPTVLRPNLDVSMFRGFKYGNSYLENVDIFKYLGFLTSHDLLHKLHVQNRNSLMYLSARLMGKLMNSLEVTNFRSLRAYFHSLVGSQLYSHSVITFEEAAFERAQKLFIQAAFNLPNSFAFYMAKFFLNVGEFSLISFDARVRFLQRIANGDSDASLNAMVMDCEFLFAYGIGWSAEFYSHYSEELELFEFDLLDAEDSLVARARISAFLAERNVRRFRDSAAAFLVDMFPDLVLPQELAIFLGISHLKVCG